MVSPESFVIHRQCTPFCEGRCKYAGQHHKILVAVINCVDERGYNKFTRTITRFMKKGWKIDDPIEDPDPEFRYPLVHWATVLGNAMVLKWCVEQGLDLNKRWGQRSETALHRLMVCGYSALRENSGNILKTFKKLVKLLKVLLQSKDDNKDLPIHVAAKVLVERPLTSDSRFDRIYTEMLKILVRITCELDMGLLNYRNIDGNTVMHIVAQHDKGAEILQLLIENGADCDLPNSEGLKPIDIARAKDATDIIGVLSKDDEDQNSSKNEDDLALEEIGDIDIIYIESDDDLDKSNNNDDKDEQYIRNLLERVKSEPDDGNDVDDTNDVDDPDWNGTDLDASTSNDTLFTMDEDSYDIDIPFGSLNEARSTLRRNDSPLDGNSEKTSSNRKRKFSDKGTVQEPKAKKPKAPNVQGKESKAVSPKLEIQLNMPKFKSLKRKIRQEATRVEKAAKSLFPINSSPDLTTQTPNEEILQTKTRSLSPYQEEPTLVTGILTKHVHSDSEVVGNTLATVVEKSNQESKSGLSSSAIAGALPGMCTDEQGEVQDEFMNDLSRVKEPLTTSKAAKHMFPSPDLTAKIPHDEIPQSRTLSSSQEEFVPQTPADSQLSFSSSDEIQCAWQRLRGKITGRGSLKGNLSQLGELFYNLKPVGTRIERPVGTSTPTAVAIEQDSSSTSPSTSDSSIPGPLSIEQHLSSSSVLSMEQHGTSPSPVLMEQLQSNRSSPSPPTDQHRSKKRIEDVITNLRERQQAGIRNTTSRRESCESLSSSENNSIEGQAKNKQSDSITEQKATTKTSLQIPAAKNDLTSADGSDSTLEQQTGVESKSSSGSSTPVTSNDEMNGERVLPPPEQHLGKSTEVSQVPNSNVAFKKEVDDSKCSGKLDGVLATGQTQPTTGTSVDSHAGDSEMKQTAASDHINNIVGDKLKKRPRIPRNALPTQVQAGSYRAMIPVGAFTSTNTSEKPADGASTSTGTSGNGSGNGGDIYQQLSSLTGEVEKLCKEVSNAPPSAHASISSNSTNSSYDPLFNVIDKFCEEVYGISRGPERNRETRGETPKQAEDSGQSNVSQQQGVVDSTPSRKCEMASTPSQVQDQATVPTRIQSTVKSQVQAEVDVTVKIKQEPGLEYSNTQNHGQMMAITHGQILGTPTSQTQGVQGQTQAASQVPIHTTQVVSTQIQPTAIPVQSQVPSLVTQQPLQTTITVQSQ
ncbi:Transcription factor MBP1, partial [Paramuricea clavata]